MALIKCPECGNDVSDKSRKCPHCGLPIGNFFSRNKKIIWAITSIISVIVICAIFVSINNFIASPPREIMSTNDTYTSKDLSIYDNQAKKYIKLGDKIDYIDDILGEQQGHFNIYCYDKQTKTPFASVIQIRYKEFSEASRERFSFCGIDGTTTSDEITERFQYYTKNEGKLGIVSYTIYFKKEGRKYKNVAKSDSEGESIELSLVYSTPSELFSLELYSHE